MNTKLQLRFLVGLILCVGCAGNRNATQVTKGATSPDFQAPDQDGTTVKLSSLQSEGPVVLSLLRSFS